jgi:hypothetical protein
MSLEKYNYKKLLRSYALKGITNIDENALTIIRKLVAAYLKEAPDQEALIKDVTLDYHIHLMNLLDLSIHSSDFSNILLKKVLNFYESKVLADYQIERENVLRERL